MIKPIPFPTADVMFPPNLEHSYFEDCARHPFRHGSSGFELVNAWWLMESSLLAYAEADFAAAQFAKAGLHLSGSQPLSGPSTQCYVAHNDDFIIVAFRGTQVFKPGAGQDVFETLQHVVSDIYADVKFKLVDSGRAGLIHRGFRDALDEISADLFRLLDELRAENSNRTIWFTGHSLGAALATLASLGYGTAKGLYTFGSPLVGDKKFAAHFDVDTFRFVNGKDIVTRVPPFGPVHPPRFFPVMYRHIGQVKYINQNREIRDRLPRRISLFGRVRNWVSRLFGGRTFSAPEIARRFPGDALIDHTPLYYALHIWNYYFSSQEAVHNDRE